MTQPGIRDLDPAIIEQVDAEINKGYELKQRGDFVGAEKHYRKAWDLVPDPKYNWDISDSILLRIARFFRDKKDFDEAKRWIRLVFDHCVILPGEGQPDLIAGTIYYEAGERDLARKYLERAYKISKGRSFQTEDIKYLKFVKEHTTT
jgi:tetratricopeptide (TPR) repeat protein